MTTDMKIAALIILATGLACALGWIVSEYRKGKKEALRKEGQKIIMSVIEEYEEDYDLPGDMPDIDYD